MRKKSSQVYSTSNAPANRNGNYSVTLDFSGARPTVEVKRQPERTTFTAKSRTKNIKK